MNQAPDGIGNRYFPVVFIPHPEIPVSDKDEDIIAIVEYRDGSIIDVVRKPL